MIMESTLTIQIVVLPNESADHLARRLGVYHPSALCRWPMRVRLLPHENVYDLVRHGVAVYIHAKDFTDLSADGATASPNITREPAA